MELQTIVEPQQTVFILSRLVELRDLKIVELRRKVELAKNALRIMNAPATTLEVLNEKE